MFAVGKTYKRKEEIHGIYGGQAQGGISTPSDHPMVFLFTSDAGENFGYRDQFRPDGTFWYTGEGQIGDMEMVRGNKAIRDHFENSKQLHLFEYTKKAYVRYLGEVKYVGYHLEERPDRDNNLRKAIIFHVALISDDFDEISEPLKKYGDTKKPTLKLSLAELRKLALQAVPRNASKTLVQEITAVRSAAVRLYALKRSNGICEGCAKPAPFKGKEGPYLEVHHVYRLSDGGPDNPSSVIALCPNCHRKVHYGQDGEQYNQKLIKYLQEKE